MKTCTKCRAIKPESDFYLGRHDCKECKTEDGKRYHHNHRDQIRKRVRKYYETNRELRIKNEKARYHLNKVAIRAKRKIFYQQHKSEILARDKAYNDTHKLERAEYAKQHYAKNRDRELLKNKEYRHRHKTRLNAKSRAYYQSHKREVHEATRKRRQIDDAFRLKLNLSGRIRIALNGTAKSAKTQTLIGCSISFLKDYLEARFSPRMSWSNYGEWHVDHRIPCARFDLTDPISQRQCFHYSNLRPLWSKDNQRKNAKLPEPHQAELL